MSNEAKSQLTVSEKATVDSIRSLLERARQGDESTLPRLRELLQSSGAADKFGGDLAFQAEHSFVLAIAGKNLLFKESLQRKLEEMRAELLGPSPTPLERLLVSRVVACWLQVQDADVRTAQAKDLSATWADFYQKRMDRANRRFLAAVKTLAVVRKLALPVLQVNIARKQVNIAAGSVTAVGEAVAGETSAADM